MPKNISPSTNIVGEPKRPRSAASFVLASSLAAYSPSRTARVCGRPESRSHRADQLGTLAEIDWRAPECVEDGTDVVNDRLPTQAASGARHEPLLYLRAPRRSWSVSHLAGAVPDLGFCPLSRFRFYPGPSSGNATPKFQTARSASAADSDLRLKGSAEFIRNLGRQRPSIKKARIAPSLKSDGPRARDSYGLPIHRRWL